MRSFSFVLSVPSRILSVSLILGRDAGCGGANGVLIAGDGVGSGCCGVETGVDDSSGTSVFRCLCSYLNLVSAFC